MGTITKTNVVNEEFREQMLIQIISAHTIEDHITLNRHTHIINLAETRMVMKARIIKLKETQATTTAQMI